MLTPHGFRFFEPSSGALERRKTHTLMQLTAVFEKEERIAITFNNQRTARLRLIMASHLLYILKLYLLILSSLGVVHLWRGEE